jgi:hypothetical protein
MKHRWAVLVLPLVLPLAMGACTGGGGDGVATADGGADAGAATSAAPDDVLASELAFIACMRDQGVEMVDPIPGDNSGRSALIYEIDVNGKGSDPAFQEALDACAAHLPPVEPIEPEQVDLERELEFAQCLRDNGVPDVPDPDPEGTTILLGESQDLVRVVSLSGTFAGTRTTRW